MGKKSELNTSEPTAKICRTVIDSYEIIFFILIFLTAIPLLQASSENSLTSIYILKAKKIYIAEFEAEEEYSFNGISEISLKTYPSLKNLDCIYEIDGDNRIKNKTLFQESGKRLYIFLPGMTYRNHSKRFALVKMEKDYENKAKQHMSPLLSIKTTDTGSYISNGYFKLLFRNSSRAIFPEVTSQLETDWLSGISIDDFIYNRSVRKGYWTQKSNSSDPVLIYHGPLMAVISYKTTFKSNISDEIAAKVDYTFTVYGNSPIIHVKCVMTKYPDVPFNFLELFSLSIPQETDIKKFTNPDLMKYFSSSSTIKPKSCLYSINSDGNSVIVPIVKQYRIKPDKLKLVTAYRHSPVKILKKSSHTLNASLYAGRNINQTQLGKILHSLTPVKIKNIKEWEFVHKDKTAFDRWNLKRKSYGLPYWRKNDISNNSDTISTDDNLFLIKNHQYVALFDKSGVLLGFCAKDNDCINIYNTNSTSSDCWRIIYGKQKNVLKSSTMIMPKVEINNDGKNPTIKFLWKHTGIKNINDDVNVHTNWTLNDKGLCGRIVIKPSGNRSLDILEVQFPYIQNLGKRHLSEIIFPRGPWGMLKKTKVNSKYYPSWMWTMQFLGIQNADGNSLYISPEDPKTNVKRFEIDIGHYFYFEFPVPDYGTKGNSFKTDYDVVLTPLKGNWLEVAKRYRKFALKQPWCAKGPLYTRKYPAKRYRDGLLWMHVFPEGKHPEKVKDIMLKYQRDANIPVGIHWYNWHVIGFDNMYPHFMPARKGFKEAVKVLRDNNITVMPYINGRLWDLESEDFEKAKPWTVKQMDGTPLVEDYRRDFAVMCPFTKFWQNKIQNIVKWIMDDLGADAVYIDQVACAFPRLCMDTRHGHKPGGGHWWIDGYRNLFKKVREVAGERLVTTENIAEPYIGSVDGFLLNIARPPDIIPLYAAVYSDMRIAFSPSCHFLERGESAKAFAMKYSPYFLWGAQLGGLDPWLFKQQQKYDFLIELAQVRLQYKDFLAYGEFLGPVIIDTSEITSIWHLRDKRTFKKKTVKQPAIRGAHWKTQDDREAIFVVNNDMYPHVADIHLPSHLQNHFFTVKKNSSTIDSPEVKATNGLFRLYIPPMKVKILEFKNRKSTDRKNSRQKSYPYLYAISGSRKTYENESIDIPEVKEPKGMIIRSRQLPDKQYPVEVLPANHAEFINENRNCFQNSSIPLELIYRISLPDSYLKLGLPSGIWAQPSNIILPSNEPVLQSRHILLHCDSTAKPGKSNLDITLHTLPKILSNTSVNVVADRIKFPISAGKAIIDADLSDWKNSRWTKLDSKKQNHLKSGTWNGINDFSVEFATMYSKDTFYFAVKIVDDIHSKPLANSAAWEGDAIQIGFLPDANNGLPQNVVEIALALTSKGPYAYFWSPPPSSYQLKIKRKDHTTIYELALPLDYISKNKTIQNTAFSFTANENDANGFEGWIETTPGICGGKNSNKFGKFFLAK